MGDEAQRTIYCGNLDSRVTEKLLFELFLQAGPLEKVKIPDGKPFGFITFEHPVSVEYTLQLMNGIRLFNQTLRLQPRTQGAPSRQNSAGSNMNNMQQQQQNGANMAAPGLMGRHPGIMNQSSPFHRSYSAPQFDSSTPPVSRYQRYQEGGNFDKRENSPEEQKDRKQDRQRDRDNRRDRSDFGRRDRDDSRDGDRGHDRYHRDFEGDQGNRGRDSGGERDFGRDRSRNRDYGREREDSRDRNNFNNRGEYGGGNTSQGQGMRQSRFDQSPAETGQMSREDSYPNFQGQGMRQSRFEQAPAESEIDIELRRHRVMSQLQFFQQMQSMRQQPGGGGGMGGGGGGNMGGQHQGHRNRGRRY